MATDTVVDENTGEERTPADYVGDLRALERIVQRCDNTIAELKADTKKLKQEREKALMRIRGLIRESKLVSGRSRKPVVVREGQ